MLNRNPLTEDEHARVSTLMREIDDLSKRGHMYASTSSTPPEVLRKAARAYNDRVAVLRVLIGNRPVERLEQKWLYGPVAWSMVVGQEWNAVVRPRERAGAGVACNPSTCRNPKHHHAARKNVDIAGAVIAGASAALVGRMIRGNPRKRRVFLKRFAAVPSERKKACPHKHVAYSGKIPCTGVRWCRMCGATEDEIRRPRVRPSRKNSRSKHRPSGRHCTSCGTPLKRGESLVCAFCRREGSYSFNKKNPLASGGWKGWSIKPGGRGFVRRFGKRVVVYIYLNRGGRAPNIWTWRVHLDGKRRYGGDVSTDEIARRRAMAVMYGTHKNPDELTGTMIVKCSTCKCVIRTEPCIQEFDGKISHGFCPTHQAEERAKVEAWIASRKASRNPSRNPPSKKEMATWPKCVTCGKPAGFSVDWLYPQRVPDNRPCCSSRCAVAAVKKGRPASNPSSKIPMYQIRNWVGKFHVGTSNQQIEAALKAQIAKSKDPRWTPATIRQAVAVALKEHHHNQAVYHQVMTGRF